MATGKLNLEERLNIASKSVADENKGEHTLAPRFQRIRKEFELMIPLFARRISKLEENLQGPLSTLEGHVRDLKRHDNEDDIESKLNAIIGDIEQIKLANPVRLINIHSEEEYQPEDVANKDSQNLQQQLEEFESREEEITSSLLQSYNNLGDRGLGVCFLSFSIFPENSVIKKRPLIYWWIGEGLIKANANGDKTADEVGEEFFKQLIVEEVIDPVFNNEWKWSPVVNKCRVNPHIRRMLISMAKICNFFAFDSTRTSSFETSCPRACFNSKTSWYDFEKGAARYTTVFNVDRRFPTLRVNWLRKLKKVEALQLGQWEDLVEYYIEMEDESLKNLGSQMMLKYLSLRGISRITELPSSIVNLSSLKILDLRACQNLERLPDKIASLRKLTHLDVSGCYFLERMPKGIENLLDLQVLKGFVVGYSHENSCRICDLSKLTNLRKLSMRIGKMDQEEFAKLNEIASLSHLTISWEENLNLPEFCLSFPPKLEKLDLRAIPLKEAPAWLHPSELENLKKLYIRGGELRSLDRENTNNGEPNGWKVEILYLKYLRYLEITLEELQIKFRHLKYLEKIKCHKEDIVWSIREGVLWSKEEKETLDPCESNASSSNSCVRDQANEAETIGAIGAEASGANGAETSGANEAVIIGANEAETSGANEAAYVAKTSGVNGVETSGAANGAETNGANGAETSGG